MGALLGIRVVHVTASGIGITENTSTTLEYQGLLTIIHNPQSVAPIDLKPILIS